MSWGEQAGILGAGVHVITRIYVHNFLCFVNFEIGLSRINLLLGPNGAGKSTIFHVLDRLVRFIVREGRVADLFPLRDVTRWETATGSQVQHFAFEMKDKEGGIYQYTLNIEHDPARRLSWVREERLSWGGRPLLHVERGEARLYDDSHGEGPKFPMDWNQSGVGFLQEQYSPSKLTGFKEQLRRVFVLQMNPANMQTETLEEADFLQRDLSNFASWYRYQSQVNTGNMVVLFKRLADILPGFHSLKLKPAGEAKILAVDFKPAGGKIFEIPFNALSDGQRALIVLYAIQAFLSDDQPATLCVDEPENFLALPEIQPWMDSMEDLSENSGHQLLIISHNPGLINFLAKDVGLWMERHQGTGPTRVKPISRSQEDIGLPLSELIARGWLFQEGEGHA